MERELHAFLSPFNAGIRINHSLIPDLVIFTVSGEQRHKYTPIDLRARVIFIVWEYYSRVTFLKIRVRFLS